MTGYEKALKALKYSSSEHKHDRVLAVLFLHFEKNLSAEEIQSKGCKLTVGGIRGFFKRFYHWLSEAIEKFIDDIVEAIQIDETIHHHFRSRIRYSSDWCAYIIECFEGAKLKFLKIGKASDFEGRMHEHLKNKKYQIDGIRINKVYYFDTEQASLDMEKELRNYYKTLFSLTRNDRFYGGHFEISDLEEINKKDFYCKPTVKEQPISQTNKKKEITHGLYYNWETKQWDYK